MTVKGHFTDLRIRLERNMEPCPTTGCWLWKGKQDKDGYGNLGNSSGGGDYKAHRLSWELNVGPIPSGLDVAHYCDCRACINPFHLYTATRTQNIADRTARKREPRGEAHVSSKLNNAAVKEIRASKDSVSKLVEKFCVSKAQIYRIKNSECWAHIKC